MHPYKTWAIMNKRTKEFVFGTDYRYRYKNGTVRQRTSDRQLLTYSDKRAAEYDRWHREMSSDYILVQVQVEVAEEQKSDP